MTTCMATSPTLTMSRTDVLGSCNCDDVDVNVDGSDQDDGIGDGGISW